MTVAQRITQYRQVAGLSQRGLATKAGLTSPAINQYESGKRVPDLKSFASICKVLGVSTDIFLAAVDL
jgi:transcriptional regulator with XRE-family HTH domain